MQLKSTSAKYGNVAVSIHWLSAALILLMISLGFLMQRADEESKLFLYRSHVVIGAFVLMLTLVRLTWKVFDTKVAPAPGIAGVHLLGMKAIHVLLYLGLFGLLISGIVLSIESGLINVIRPSSGGNIPELSKLNSRAAHGSLARLYIGLLIAHIGGVIVHHMRYGNVFPRMGLGELPADSAATGSGDSVGEPDPARE